MGIDGEGGMEIDLTAKGGREGGRASPIFGTTKTSEFSTKAQNSLAHLTASYYLCNSRSNA